MTSFAARLGIQRPDQAAIRDERACLGWGAVDDALNRVANAVLALDLGPERRVAVFAENAVETALAHIGALIGGASTVPVNFHLTADEVAYILADSGCRALFVGPETAERGMAAAKSAGVPLVVGWQVPLADRRHAGLHDWDAWLAAAPAAEPPADTRP